MTTNNYDYCSDYTSFKARLPVKWTPPESLFRGESSTMSDVYVNLIDTMHWLTNRRHSSMVFTLIDRRMTSKKCSKLKWNHEPQASGFTAK